LKIQTWNKDTVYYSTYKFYKFYKWFITIILVYLKVLLYFNFHTNYDKSEKIMITISGYSKLPEKTVLVRKLWRLQFLIFLKLGFLS